MVVHNLMVVEEGNLPQVFHVLVEAVLVRDA